MPAKPAKKATAIPAKRLGDDMPDPRPASREPVSLIVARTGIAGGKVHLALEPVEAVQVPRGQTLTIKHTYRLKEESPDEEEYRFLLRSSLDRKSPPPAMARFGDVYAVPDDVAGFLHQEHRLDKAGTFTLDFEVGAEYIVMDWKTKAVSVMDRKELKGSIQVHVR